MTDPLVVPQLSVQDAARVLGVSAKTVRRYFKGTRAHDGRVVVLQSIFVGGRRRTSEEAIREFLEDLNRRPLPRHPPSRRELLATRAARQRRTNEILRQEGLLRPRRQQMAAANQEGQKG